VESAAGRAFRPEITGQLKVGVTAGHGRPLRRQLAKPVSVSGQRDAVAFRLFRDISYARWASGSCDHCERSEAEHVRVHVRKGVSGAAAASTPDT